jgi:hypothetical protein
VAFLFAYDGEVSAFGPGLKNHLGAAAWLVRAGWAQVTMREDGQVVRAGPGEWLMVRPGLRVQEFAPDTHLLSVNFLASLDMGDPFFREGLSLVLSAKKHPALERQGLRLLRVARAVLRADPRRVQSLQNLSLKEYLRLQSSLLDWFRVWSGTLEAAGLRQHRSIIQDPRAVQALEGMRKHVGDPDYDPHTLAATVGLSPSQPYTASCSASIGTATSSGSGRRLAAGDSAAPLRPAGSPDTRSWPSSRGAMGISTPESAKSVLTGTGAAARPPRPPRRRRPEPVSAVAPGASTSARAEAAERTRPVAVASGCRLSWPGRTATWPSPPQLGQARPNSS